MSSPSTGTAILFQDDFSANGQQLDPATWDYNRWPPADNPSFLGLTEMGQSFPLQENGLARHAVCSSGDGSSTR
jgi:hypothetical protein